MKSLITMVVAMFICFTTNAETFSQSMTLRATYTVPFQCGFIELPSENKEIVKYGESPSSDNVYEFVVRSNGDAVLSYTVDTKNYELSEDEIVWKESFNNSGFENVQHNRSTHKIKPLDEHRLQIYAELSDHMQPSEMEAGNLKSEMSITLSCEQVK